MLHARQDFIQHNEFLLPEFHMARMGSIMCIITEISFTMTT